jgi:hypothetical protein
MRLRGNRELILLGAVPIAVVGLFLVLGSSESAPPTGSLLVYTEVAATGSLQNLLPEESRLVLVDLVDPQRPPEVLVPGFAATRSASVSFDGRRILFSGKQSATDPWQIWELKLGGGTPTLIVGGYDDCTDPTYLPDDGIAFTARVPGSPDQHALFVQGPGGTGTTRITHHPYSDFGSTVSRDGRLLYSSTAGSPGAPDLFAVRYDGTGSELIYRGPEGMAPTGRAWDDDESLILFVEKEARADGGRLVATDYARPLHTRREVAADLPGDFHSVYPMPSGDFLISWREPGEEVFGLYRLNVREGRAQPIATRGGAHAVDPVLIAERRRPLGFVSAVEPGAEAGTLYCVDADHSSLAAASDLRSALVRIISSEGVIGEVPLEVDGSFHLTVPADTPLRFQTIDGQGRVVREMKSWTWVRPHEQRGCVGCHEDRELVPENVVPLAIMKEAVALTLPAHVPVAEGGM